MKKDTFAFRAVIDAGCVKSKATEPEIHKADEGLLAKLFVSVVIFIIVANIYTVNHFGL